MVLLSGTFTMLSRMIGTVATKTLGWAVILLFGRVPQARQRLLSFMALASIAWMVAIAACFVPAANGLVVSAVPRPGFVQRDWIAWLLVAGALLLPAAVGLATLAISPEDARPSPLGASGRVLRGYLLTPALAGTIVFLAAWAVARSVRAMRRGWDSVHIAMIVKPGAYDAVVDDVEAALVRAGLGLVRGPASAWLLLPPRLLAWAGGLETARSLPDALVAFEGDDLHVLVYPSDVALVGRADRVAAARSAVARRLTFADAYLTTAQESEQIEDRIRELARRPFVQATDFQPIDALLSHLVAPYDEWETLFRLRLQVEHDVLAAAAPTIAGQR